MNKFVTAVAVAFSFLFAPVYAQDKAVEAAKEEAKQAEIKKADAKKAEAKKEESKKKVKKGGC